MSKGLEALEKIKDNLTAIHSQFPHEECPNLNDYVKKLYGIDIIEKELKEYEMEHTLRIRLENINYELVREKQENEKKLKALVIIKELLNSFDELPCGKYVQEEIANIIRKFLKEHLTKDKLDLLKEVFEQWQKI